MQLKVGEIVEGTVKSLTKFGAFVALAISSLYVYRGLQLLFTLWSV